MIYAIQILKMLDNRGRRLFIELFNDLSYERFEMGYDAMEDELISDILFNHFGLEIECQSQLEMFTAYILKHQNNLERSVNGICLMSGMKVA